MPSDIGPEDRARVHAILLDTLKKGLYEHGIHSRVVTSGEGPELEILDPSWTARAKVVIVRAGERLSYLISPRVGDPYRMVLPVGELTEAVHYLLCQALTWQQEAG